MHSKLAANASETPGILMVFLVQAESYQHQDAGKPETLLEMLTLLVNQRLSSPGLTNCQPSAGQRDSLASLTIQGKHSNDQVTQNCRKEKKEGCCGKEPSISI